MIFNKKSRYFKLTCIHLCLSCLFILVSLHHALPLFAAIYYVSPSGSDTNPGTELSPFFTIQRAADSTKAGDTVIVKDGLYTSSKQAVLDINQSGSPTAYILFESEKSHGAIIDANTNTTDYGIILRENAAYIKINGFEIRNAKSSGIYGWGNSNTGMASHHIVISDNIIHHNGRVTVSDPDDGYGRCGFAGHPLIYNYTFTGNIIHDNGRLSDSSQEHAYRHDHGLYLQGRYMTVENNVFFNHTAGWAIKVDGYWGSSIADSEHSHIIKGNSFRPLVRSDPNGGGYIRFYNNNTYNIEYGYMKTPKNVLIENNYFYKPDGPATNSAIVISNDPCCNFSGTIIRNNITTGTHLYSEDLGIEIQNNVTASNNTLNADESLFILPPKSPQHLILP